MTIPPPSPPHSTKERHLFVYSFHRPSKITKNFFLQKFIIFQKSCIFANRKTMEIITNKNNEHKRKSIKAKAKRKTKFNNNKMKQNE